MGNIYHQCLTSILLCKKNYAEHGHVTQRIHEVAINGVIAMGLKEYDLTKCVKALYDMSIESRQSILDYQIEKLEPFDINNVIRTFYNVIGI